MGLLHCRPVGWYLVEEVSVASVVVGRHPPVPHAHAHHRNPGGGAGGLVWLEVWRDSRDRHVVQHVLLMDPLDDGGNKLAGIGLTEGVEVIGLERERLVVSIDKFTRTWRSWQGWHLRRYKPLDLN